LFVWAKLPSIASAEAFINDILYQKHLFITPGTILVVMVKVIFGLHCASKRKIQEAIDRFCVVEMKKVGNKRLA
jgi:aspartate/methionine/tyrosine aminotransferase